MFSFYYPFRSSFLIIFVNFNFLLLKLVLTQNCLLKLVSTHNWYSASMFTSRPRSFQVRVCHWPLAENWPHPAINSSLVLSRVCDAHREREGREEELWEWGKRRGAGYVYRYRIRSPRRWPRGSFNGDYRKTWTRASECRGVVKRWFRPSLADPRRGIVDLTEIRSSSSLSGLFMDLAPRRGLLDNLKLSPLFLLLKNIFLIITI